MKLSKEIRKNLLDLKYTEYSQYLNTSIVVCLTFLIGILVTMLTQKLNVGDLRILSIILVSGGFIVIIGLFIFNFKRRMILIVKEIRNLDKTSL